MWVLVRGEERAVFHLGAALLGVGTFDNAEVASVHGGNLDCFT